MNTHKPLQKELETYEDNKSRLISESLNEYVLIKGDDIIGTFESHADAIKEGYQRYGTDVFLVKQVLEIEPQINFFSHYLGI